MLNPTLDENSAADLLTQTRERVPALDAALRSAQELANMFRRRTTKPLEDWLQQASQSEIGELKSFARGLKSDAAAVQSAMTEDWSNGPVEGHVNRLKFIKRSMYGRAKLDLLRARVCNTN
ncbi:MAG: transposase [Gemmataceae bacterium]